MKILCAQELKLRLVIYLPHGYLFSGSYSEHAIYIAQDLTITQQLDAGIRFLDVRMMMEYTDEPHEWYSLHMMQSRDTSLHYFHEVRSWMDAHPTEVVVMWLSKHGNECATGQEQVRPPASSMNIFFL